MGEEQRRLVAGSLYDRGKFQPLHCCDGICLEDPPGESKSNQTYLHAFH
jgi:hypothetical protein